MNAPAPGGGRHMDEMLAMAVTLIVGAQRVADYHAKRAQRHPILGHLVLVEHDLPYLTGVFDGRIAPPSRPMPLCWCGAWHPAPIPHRRANRIASKWEGKGWLNGSGNRAELSGLTADAPDGFKEAILSTARPLWAFCEAESAIVKEHLLRFR